MDQSASPRMRPQASPPFVTTIVLLLFTLAPSHTVAISEAASQEFADPFETLDSAVDAESFGPHIDFSSSGSAGAGGGVDVLPGGPPTVPRVAQLRGASDDVATQASSAVAAGDNPRVARLYLLSKKNSRARCLDGSPAGYYLRRGFGSGANNWIMILEAGGWCFNAKSCANRAKGPLGSSKKWPPTSDVKYGGVGSTDSAVNPAFYNWNLVLVKYCDGSSFTGGYSKLPPNSETGRALYFRGHWNLQGTLQDLLARHGLNVGKQMLVGGCSAGGVATSIKCDQISRWLANYNVTTKCFMDGGYFPDVADKDGQYSMRLKVQQMAGVHDMGRIGVNAECKRGVMDIGARDAVRGAKSSGAELFHILENSDSTAVIVDNVQVLEHIAPFLEASSVKDIVKFAVVLWPPAGKGQEQITDWKTRSTCSKWFSLYSFEEVSAAGSASRLTHDALSRSAPRQASRPDDVATLVYTSGTTGNPKGVMLTHSNLMHQVNNFECALTPDAGDVMLSLLPPWHMYERSCEYFLLSRGVQLVYSNVKSFKEDLMKHPPDYFVAVPLVFEVLYSGVQKKLAAASAARAAIAKFLIKVSCLHKEALRIWTGMAVLRSRENVQGLMFMKAVAECLGAGLLALVLLPLHLLAEKLVYTKVKAAIGIKKAAVSGGGSLPSHVDKFFEQIGITLLNGYGLTETSPVLTVRQSENVDPAFVEEVALSSPVIRQIILVGQDQRKLGALIVVNEDEMKAAVASMRAEKGIEGSEVTEKEQRAVVQQELTRCFTEAGCLPHERVGPFALLDEPFTVDNGLLTATMKMRRDVIYSRHKELCDQLFQH
ncbi:unnamed protein product [Closterium sp. Naga37s-1]|nr:unnamed protein product [Closterium sp. Naga37s-1]